MQKIITKYCAPTKLDTAPFGNIWRHAVDDNVLAYYIQLSETDEMKWRTLGYLFEEIFMEKIHNEHFIKECITRYRLLHAKS